MKSKKKKLTNSSVVVVDATKKLDLPVAATQQPYLGGLQPGLEKNKKIFAFILLGVLVIISAAWLFLHNSEEGQKYSPEKVYDPSEMQDTGKPINGINDPKESINDADKNKL